MRGRGVALTRTIEEGRRCLAKMLFLCDPATPAIADITDARAVRTIRTYSGSVSEVYAQLAARPTVVDDDDDKRRAILARRGEGESLRTIARGVEVSLAVVHRVVTEHELSASPDHR